MWPVILKIISYFFLTLFALGVVLMFLTWRKAKFVKPKWIMFGQIVALVSLMVFTALARNPLGQLWWNLLIILGLAGGIIYGKMVKVTQSLKGIMMNYTLPYLITWSALLVLTQFLTISSGRVPVMVLGLSVINTGLNLGMNGRVVWNYQKLKKGKA
ncbi:MAG: hypothetical protein HZC17_05980 [Candidatus Omnitrophica bacterium]|nr:hypothetical protein [Candidatus Omnitrophota bacterium]